MKAICLQTTKHCKFQRTVNNIKILINYITLENKRLDNINCYGIIDLLQKFVLITDGGYRVFNFVSKMLSVNQNSILLTFSVKVKNTIYSMKRNSKCSLATLTVQKLKMTSIQYL